MGKKTYTLTQDNGACNNNKKLSVRIVESDLKLELKKFFRWRKDINAERLYKQGSRNYDLFIKHLHENGY